MSLAISAAKTDGTACRGEMGLIAWPDEPEADSCAAFEELLASEESSVDSAAFKDATLVSK
jgi:hypothetical protein